MHPQVRNVVQPSSNSALLNCLRLDSGHQSQRAFHRAKAAPMMFSCAMFSQLFQMESRWISLVLGETIRGISEVQRGHFGIARHFGND